MTEPETDRLLRAADAAYAVYHPATNPKLTGKERAWRGPPEKNPLLRPLKAALAVMNEEGRWALPPIRTIRDSVAVWMRATARG